MKRGPLAAAVALDVVIALADAITGDRVVLTGLFLVAPLGLALVGDTRDVAGVAALSVVLALLSGVWNEYLFSLDHLVRLIVVASGSAAAVFAARARTRAEGLVDELRTTRERLDRILGALSEAVTVQDADGGIVFANPAALKLMGLSRIDTAPGELAARYTILREDGTPLPLDELPGRRVLRGEDPEPLLLRWLQPEGGARWMLIKASRYEDAGRSLAVNVIEDVTQSKESELRQRFLAHASEVLSSSLDYEETLRRVAGLAVPELAEWCGVELVDERGNSHQVAVAHVDPAKVEFARELRERYPPDPDSATGVPAVLRTGRPVLMPAVTDAMLVAGARDEEHLRLARELRIGSAMVVPMRLGDRVIGAISFVAGQSSPAYDEAALTFAQDLAARAATAVENARLYSERSQAAETLQRSLLPAELPDLPGWRTATLYRPADQATQVGGDFFDLFRIPDGFAVVLGDVTGKGVPAAALTALARHSARTAAMLGLPPTDVLDLLNRTLLEQPEMSLVTVVCGQFAERPGAVQMTVASAGHPPPLRCRRGEAPTELGDTGVLLGIEPVAGWPQRTFAVEPGDTVLFYTDGVTDTPGAGGRFGEARLREQLAAGPDDPGALLTRIDGALRAFQAGTVVDDTALLAVQLSG